MKEPFLEPILRRYRISRLKGYISPNDRILDVGCGWGATTLKAIAPNVAEVVGVDRKVEITELPRNAKVYRQDFCSQWHFEESHFTMVLLLAVLEHLTETQADTLLQNIFRTLQPRGRLFITVPTPNGKRVLEFLSFTLGMVNPDEIRDHKIYYDKTQLVHTLSKNGFSIQAYKVFQCGMNSTCIAIKPTAQSYPLTRKSYENTIT